MIEDYSLCTYVIGRQDTVSNTICMLGTGFLVTESLIVTAYHVINDYPDDLFILLPQIGSINEYQDTDEKQCRPIHCTIKAVDQFRDICVLELANSVMRLPIHWSIGSLDQIAVGEYVGIWGFPHCVDGRRVLTYQRTELGAKMLMSTKGIKSKYGTINIQTRPGQSGSPVFSLSSGEIIGVLVGAYAPKKLISIGGLNPHELNQTSFCISLEYLFKLL